MTLSPFREGVAKTREASVPCADDVALARQAHSGSPTAIAELYQRYGRAVYRIAYRLTGSQADAEDVLQDVFLGLPEALRTYAARGSLGAWIGRVATRAALMRLRSVRRKNEVTFEESAVHPTTTSAPADRLAIQAAIEALPDALRVVFVLRAVEGYSHSEIASLLGIRVGSSKVRFHRARKRLRRYLDGSA